MSYCREKTPEKLVEKIIRIFTMGGTIIKQTISILTASLYKLISTEHKKVIMEIADWIQLKMDELYSLFSNVVRSSASLLY